MPANDITFADVRRLFDYKDGNLWWRERVNPRVNMAVPAGCHDKRAGYRVIRYNKRLYLAHRLIWLYHTGAYPVGVIDHIDGDPSNNSLKNLRDVTNAQNSQNAKRPKNNKSGLKGVFYRSDLNKWRAELMVNGKVKRLGFFDCKAAAYFSYCVASDVHHGGFGRVE